MITGKTEIELRVRRILFEW